MKAVWIILLFAPTPAFAADQFDLVCKGSDAEVHYRVDLSSGEVCANDCDRIWKIGQVTAGEIRLIDRSAAYRGDLDEKSIVSRQSGDWSYSMSLNGKVYSRSGRCDIAAFSGFPARKF